ncbi:UNVERIFIED_CONTAM: hypothetical protein K2H54_071468 [Gekko kuhli]
MRGGRALAEAAAEEEAGARLRTTMKQQPAAAAMTTSPSGAGTAVPAFLSKLWALVGDAPSNQLITWSQAMHHLRARVHRGPWLVVFTAGE